MIVKVNDTYARVTIDEDGAAIARFGQVVGGCFIEDGRAVLAPAGGALRARLHDGTGWNLGLLQLLLHGASGAHRPDTTAADALKQAAQRELKKRLQRRPRDWQEIAGLVTALGDLRALQARAKLQTLTSWRMPPIVRFAAERALEKL